MAVNKNFVVKNGLEVNSNLLVADLDTQTVGIGTTIAPHELHVVGGIGVTNLLVTGVATIANLRVTGPSTFVGVTTFTDNNVFIDKQLFVNGISITGGSGGSIGTDLHVQRHVRAGGIVTFSDSLFVGSGLGQSTGTSGQVLQVAGVSSGAYFGGQVGIGTTNPAGGGAGDVALHVVGDSRFVGLTTFTGITTFKSDVSVQGNLKVTGDITYDEITGRSLNISGLATFQTLTQNRVVIVGAGDTLTDTNSLRFADNNLSQLVLGVGATVGGALTVAGATDLNSTLDVENLATFGPVGVADSIFHEGDTNTAIRFPSADTFKVQTGGTDRLTIGPTGVATFSGAIDANNGIDASTAKVEDLTNNRVVIAGTNGELEDSSNFVFDGSQLILGVGATVGGVTTSRGFVLAADDGIHFDATAANDINAILREDSSNTLLVNSQNDVRINIDSNNDETTRVFSIGHNAATGSSTELFRIDESGDVGIGTTNPTGNNAVDAANEAVLAVGVVTARQYFGDASNLSNLPATTTINNNADNRLITGSGTANTLEGEANLTFDGSQFAVVSSGATVGGALTVAGATDLNGALDVTGETNFSSGVGIADSIFHIGDDNTQIRFPAADTFTVETGGTERLRINSDGEVGVGVQADGDALHVKGVSAGSTVARFTSNNTDALTNLAVFERNGSAVKAAIRYNGTASPLTIDYGTITNHGIDFFTNNTSRLHIQNTGQIGIGTTKPDNFNNNAEDLVISGLGHQGLTIRSGTAHDGSIMFNDTTDANQRGIIRFDHTTDAMAFHTSGGEALRITSAGDVGIGTTIPTGNNAVDDANEAVLAVGVVTARQFFGDGSNLSGVIAGVGIRSDSTTIGFGVTFIDFIGPGIGTITTDTNSGIATVDVQGGGSGGGGGSGVTETDTTVSTVNPTGVGSFATASFRSASVIAQINQLNTDFQVGRYLMIHDGTTVTVVEEAAVSTGSTMLGSFTGVIDGSNVELRVTLASAGVSTVTTKIDTVTV